MNRYLPVGCKVRERGVDTSELPVVTTQMYSPSSLHFKLKNVKVNIPPWNVTEISERLFVFPLEYEAIVSFVPFKVLYTAILAMFDVRVVVLHSIITCFPTEPGT